MVFRRTGGCPGGDSRPGWISSGNFHPPARPASCECAARRRGGRRPISRPAGGCLAVASHLTSRSLNLGRGLLFGVPGIVGLAVAVIVSLIGFTHAVGGDA